MKNHTGNMWVFPLIARPPLLCNIRAWTDPIRKVSYYLYPRVCHLPEHPLKGDEEYSHAAGPEDWPSVDRQPLVGWNCCVAIHQAGQLRSGFWCCEQADDHSN